MTEKKPRVYLASPYSDPNPLVKEARFYEVSAIAAWLQERLPVWIFCPIAHSHPLAEYGGMRGDWGFWEQYDLEFLRMCDELWVVTMDGWTNSTGVQAELHAAIQSGKKVRFVDPGWTAGSEPGPDEAVREG